MVSSSIVGVEHSSWHGKPCFIEKYVYLPLLVSSIVSSDGRHWVLLKYVANYFLVLLLSSTLLGTADHVFIETYGSFPSLVSSTLLGMANPVLIETSG